MAKISPVSIKYMIYASFKAEGPLEKPDVIGALFGQTEGLLGSELEMRELQKEGKLGRIDVDLETVDGKSVGEIRIPSALDKSETTLIAAALETIDRIGPTEAKIEVNRVEDVRGSKREFILERAKKLLEGLESKEGGEMGKVLREETRAAKIQEYGDEKLPAGDLSGEEIIVVEGRADVVNLLKNRVNNVIGMNGTKLPLEIAKLGKEKKIILFVDGDRGGKLIAKNVVANANIESIAVAPDGKEVEELAGKEILIALRKRFSVNEFLRRNRYDLEEAENENEKKEITEKTEEKDEPVFKGDVKAEIKKKYEEIKGTKQALILDGNMDVIRKVSSKDVTRSIRYSKQKVFAVIIDGNAVGAIINACDESGVSYLGATNFSSFDNAKVNLISL
jgi:DNA primase